MTPLVKICGLTTPADARAAAEAGADFIGVNLWPGSSRFVSRETARALRAAVDGGPTVVALLVDATAAEIADALAETGIAHAQLHGPVPEGVTPFIRAISPPAPAGGVGGGPVRDVSPADKGHALPQPLPASWEGSSWLLLDTHVPGQRGGTGRTFDWSLAQPYAARRPVMLAGGLTPANVAEAVAISGAQAVDVCTGVEHAPGVKDHAAIRAFVRAAKAAASPQSVVPANAGTSTRNGETVAPAHIGVPAFAETTGKA